MGWIWTALLVLVTFWVASLIVVGLMVVAGPGIVPPLYHRPGFEIRNVTCGAPRLCLVEFADGELALTYARVEVGHCYMKAVWWEVNCTTGRYGA